MISEFIVLLIGGLITLLLGIIETVRTQAQSLIPIAIVIIGITLVLVALIR